MIAMTHGRAAVLDFTIGGNGEGDVQAYRLRIVQDVGAYPRIGAVLPGFTGLMASGVYAIPRIETEFASVVTNTTPIGPFRGAGRPEATQAIERAMDLYANELGLDPAEVRRRNLFAADAFPLTTASGASYDCGDYEKALDLALETAGYASLRDEQQRRRERVRPARARYRRQRVRRDHERPRRARVRGSRDHAGRRSHPPHGLVLARAGARDDVRDDRRGSARPTG